jgi:SAM-dependent methyltransferase
MGLVGWLDKRFYPGVRGNWDDDIFRRRVLDHLTSDMRLLDLGAGAGIVPQMNFRGLTKWVTGIDPNERVRDNPFLDEGLVATGESLPFPDCSFDIVISDNVLEHLESPARVFAEVRRVLKPGGLFLAKTPNRRHYMALVARLTPHWFHRLFNRLRGLTGEDVFVTRYRVNTRRDLTKAAGQADLDLLGLDYLEGRPEYLRIAAPTYILGMLYERLVNALPALRSFRILLIVTFMKPVSSPAATT